MDLKEIAKKLESVVRDAEAEAIRKRGGDWKERYEWLTSELRQLRDEAEALREDMKANALTAGSIEAEGFLRCAITVCNTIERVDASYEQGT